jgi:lipid A 4'-phosphatase
MNRTGLLIALAVAAVTGLVFGLYSGLDLKLSAPWFDAAHHGFWARVHPGWLWARSAATWIVTAIALPAFLALAWKLVLPRRRLLLSGRAVVFLIATLALAPGIVANVVLKDNWNRPRPIDVAEYGGEEHFVPWWDPRGDCPKNCSFVAGEPSGAFWTMAPAALSPPQWRPLAYAAAIAFGAGVGLVRLAGGGHFVSDIVFAGVFTFLVIWCVHGLIYRWRTRVTDAQVEGFIERLAMPGHDLLVRLFARIQRMIPRRG